MNSKRLLSNMSYAFGSQGISLIVSAIMSLVVPKILGVTEFGYWQLFIFYTGYSGFLLFGLNDGIYLLEGGKSRAQIDKSSISGQFIIACAFQLLVGLFIAIYACTLGDEASRQFVLLALAYYIIVYNLSGMLGYLFQALNETKLYSLSIMLDRLVFLAPLLLSIILQVKEFQYYIISYCASKTIALIYCVLNAKDILVSPSNNTTSLISQLLMSIKAGFPLMLANIADSLMLGVARLFIDNHWGIDSFGQVSLAISLVNFFIVFVSQASMVLFPMLRMCQKDEQCRAYVRIRDVLEVCFPAAYLLYFPIVSGLEVWLPSYASSLKYFALLLPLCVFNTKMSLCCTTYMKVLRKERLLLLINLIAVLMSAVLIFGIFSLSQSIEGVLAGAVIASGFRSTVSDFIVGRLINIPPSGRQIAGVVLSISFVILALVLSRPIGFSAYAFIYALYCLLNKKEIIRLISSVHRIRR